MTRVELRVHGLDCAEEVTLLRGAVGPLPGVQSLTFDLLHQKMTVELAPGGVAAPDLIASVKRAGLRAEPFAGGHAGPQAEPARRGRLAAVAVSGAALAAGFLLQALAVGPAAALGGGEPATAAARAAWLAATVAGAWFVLPKAWAALRALRADMNLLMVVAVAGALALGEWFEGATVAFLFALSLALEAWSVGRARRAITALLALEPEQARVLHEDGREELVAAQGVRRGTRFLVRPGERIPLDGDVVAGATSVDQAPITGESVPVPRSPGEPVLAGTINHEGAIEVVATRDAQDSVLAHVVRSVREALGKRSPSEQWVDAFARWYTPLVVLAAALLAVVPPLAGGAWDRWFYEALVLLVIACPCALVISTPVSIVSALAAAARHGVLVKGGAVLELAARVRAVAFDKTGTVTLGALAVTEVVPLSGHDEREVLEIAAGIEKRSEHPIGRAIVAHAAAAGIAADAVTAYRAFPGRGAEAVRAGQPVWIGSHRFLEERGEEPPELHDRLEQLARSGNTVVVVGEQHHVCGAIAVADQLRPGAAAAVRELLALGVGRVVLLTGDNAPTAAAIGRLAGIDDVRADLLPQDKVAAVAELVERHGVVAMVGDGVNDAPALARASLGIAMGTAGSDVALETADVALMQDDLRRLPWLVRLARRTRAVVRQNVGASLAVKAAFVGLAAGGLGSLWGAIAADMGMSLLVVGNALRLLRVRE